ncbi:MAG: alkaline phosphatase family protein [Bacteroidetes bacterium]|nr:MAG: alkaline phosphatase family protein [Bacteroidota bacterium]TAG93952.1 MAG: alkaline phosphatase family protein [Bacteroidota bacterium]
MKKISLVFYIIFLFSCSLLAQNNEKPKLIVGIVIDQMRYDYLSRYNEKFGDGGFRRLLKQGFNCKNAHYNYAPTETAPGHASIYTGTTPATHGIVANNWFEKGKYLYCVTDTTTQLLGALAGEGSASPRNLLMNTFGDELKIATMGKSKVFGVSLKDRGAVLPAGHAANAAYWFDGVSGNFVTSTYYMDKIPTYLEKFNQRKLSDKFLKDTWKTLYPIEKYTESTMDNTNFEQKLGNGKDAPTFPYIMPEIVEKAKKNQFKKPIYELLRYTPFGNTLVKEMALTILTEEKLGKNNQTDVLAISFSSTDLAGHLYGGQSIEVEDIYLRLDRELEEIFENLDKEVGEDSYVVFLTADHAGAYPPNFLKSMKIPAGFFDFKAESEFFKMNLEAKFGKGDWVAKFDDQNIYFNKNLISQNKLELEDFEKFAIEHYRKIDGVFDVLSLNELVEEGAKTTAQQMWLNGYYHKRSADILIALKPNWIDKGWYEKGGSNHGSTYNHDSHVPILFYGWKIPKGKYTSRRINITDIAPTITNILNIQKPNGSNGEPILEVLGE